MKITLNFYIALENAADVNLIKEFIQIDMALIVFILLMNCSELKKLEALINRHNKQVKLIQS